MISVSSNTSAAITHYQFEKVDENPPTTVSKGAQPLSGMAVPVEVRHCRWLPNRALVP